MSGKRVPKIHDPDDDIPMNKALRDEVGICRGIVNRTVETVLANYRELGERITTIQQDTSIYGDGCMLRLAEAVELSPETLYKSASFFQQYDKKQYEKLIGRRTARGNRLSWSHVIALLSVPTVEERTEFEEMAAQRSLTAKELHELIMAKYGNRREGSGRGLPQPKTVREGLKNLSAAVTDYRKRAEQVWDPLFESAVTLPADTVTNEDRKTVEKTLSDLNAMSELLQRHKDFGQRVLDHMNKCLKKDKKEGA